MVYPLDSVDAKIETVGGKGANLARMARAGFAVPGGFLIGVAAYHAYLERNRLAEAIENILAAGDLEQPAGLEAASTAIRALFRADGLSDGLAGEICTAYQAMGSPPVAVRSSATAEDLPEMSFAGQQDTYLNVVGTDALLRAVVACWGSLWTARAIGYRKRQGVGQAGLGLAVVVQEMVASESSGVLFTANPLSGLRSQCVIDATLGLGEALVSGLVEPDHYVVDTASGQILEKKLGAKALAIRPVSGGGTQSIAGDAGAVQALSDEQIVALAGLGQHVAAEYGSPQDIEWAVADGNIYLLQTRAITSLYPLPDGFDANELRVLASFGAVQGMLDPMTPLGRDMICSFAGGAAGLYGLKRDETSQGAIKTAGERLWSDITPVVRNPVGRGVARFALRYVEESTGQALEQVWDDPRLLPNEKRLRLKTGLTLGRFFVPLAARLALTLLRPDAQRQKVVASTEKLLAEFQARCEQVQGEPAEKLRQRVVLLRYIRTFGPKLLKTLVPVLGAGMSQFAQLRQQAEAVDAAQGTGQTYRLKALEITRGLKGNVTTEMDLILWESARAIRSDPAALAALRGMPAEKVAAAYRDRTLPRRALEVLDAFLKRYGLRGLAEIDVGRERWLEDPLHVIQALGSYLQIEDTSLAPDAVFARGAQAGLEAAKDLEAAVRKLPHGYMRAARVRFAASRVRALLSIRESPKFLAVRLIGSARMSLLESGKDYTRLGVIKQPDDLFYLFLKELEALASGTLPDPQSIIAQRRAAFEREKRRRQIPRLLLSDGRAFYEGMSARTASVKGGLHGDPVSPGLAEGRVRVILDPRGAQLAPGEILVCPGTDPSWTPLFLAAGALVMEVGGMMTHGAVVAREYGIPAVVGVTQATLRLKDGQRARINGSTGEIVVLE